MMWPESSPGAWRKIHTDRVEILFGAINFPGKGHDRVVVRPSFVGVADGATPLHDSWPDPGAFADDALRELHSAAQDESSTPQIWFHDAIRNVSNRQPWKNGDVSAAVSVASWSGAALTVAALGDCTSTILLKDAPAVVLKDDRISVLDSSVEGDADQRMAKLRSNRSLANTHEGYWIFGGEPDAALHVMVREFCLSSVNAVVLCSDGATNALDRLGASPESIVEKLRGGAAITWLDEMLYEALNDDIAMIVCAFE